MQQPVIQITQGGCLSLVKIKMNMKAILVQIDGQALPSLPTDETTECLLF